MEFKQQTDFEHKLTWRVWLSFLFIALSFSGVLANAILSMLLTHMIISVMGIS